MTAPTLVASYFGDGAAGQWPRLARVLAYTAAQHCPHWARQIDAIRPTPMTSAIGHASHVANTQKMIHWGEAVAASAEGDRLALLDADLMILRPLDPIWDLPFDVAYTVKDSRFPFNSGVVFVRSSPAARRFVAAWLAENIRMLGDGAAHAGWRRKYGGINQASLGYVLEHNLAAEVAILPIPCLEWNCEDHSWRAYNPSVTRIVHVKSRLRMSVFRLMPTDPALRGLVKRWHALEAEAGRAALQEAVVR